MKDFNEYEQRIIHAYIKTFLKRDETHLYHADIVSCIEIDFSDINDPLQTASSTLKTFYDLNWIRKVSNRIELTRLGIQEILHEYKDEFHWDSIV